MKKARTEIDYERMREKYRPLGRINYLLIAEAPPLNNGDKIRFIYNDEVYDKEILLESLIYAIFSELPLRRSDNKEQLKKEQILWKKEK